MTVMPASAGAMTTPLMAVSVGRATEDPRQSPRCQQPRMTSNGFPTFSDGLPDFGRMDVVQRLAYHRQRLGLGR